MERPERSAEIVGYVRCRTRIMFIQTTSQYYQSSLLASISPITHGFSMRTLGDMRKDEKRQDFLTLLSCESKYLKMGEQVHGSNITPVTLSSESQSSKTDGLLAKRNGGETRNLSIGVIVADCVPLLLSDRLGNVIAAIHAGWKGTMSNNAGKAVGHIVACGISPSDIVVAIGPRIGMCCYDIPEDRAKQFQLLFGDDHQAINENNGRWYADLGYMNVRQLVSAGVPRVNIDIVPMCTSCQINRFYSYRKDTKETFGEILGVIAFQ